MVNTAAQGARVENMIRRDLEARGFYVVRSAGSKGRADLVALGLGVVLLVQCKRNARAIRPAEREALYSLAAWATGMSDVLAVVAEKQPRRPIAYYLLTFGIGAKGIPYDPRTEPMGTIHPDLLEGGNE